MLKERISKLQEWILKRIEEKTIISQRGLKRYFNKELRDPLMNKERVTLFKSLKNMISKGLIKEGEFESYILTEKGFNSHKVNVSGTGVRYSNYKAHIKGLRNLIDNLKRSKRA